MSITPRKIVVHEIINIAGKVEDLKSFIKQTFSTFLYLLVWESDEPSFWVVHVSQTPVHRATKLMSKIALQILSDFFQTA